MQLLSGVAMLSKGLINKMHLQPVTVMGSPPSLSQPHPKWTTAFLLPTIMQEELKLTASLMLISGSTCCPKPSAKGFLSLLDDMASARLFDCLINAFLTVALGFDHKECMPNQEGGLFGHVKAFFGMVETQGHGTFHLHLILWLYGSPRTTTECQDRNDTDTEYENMLLDYAQSVVTNTLPVDILCQPCPKCQHEGPCYTELPIPVATSQTPFCAHRPSFVPKEPIMAECQYCSTQVSSQHMM